MLSAGRKFNVFGVDKYDQVGVRSAAVCGSMTWARTWMPTNNK